MNQVAPSVIATGDFLYFAPAGQAYVLPAAGIVSANAIPGGADPVWQTFALGTVKEPSVDKRTSKVAKIKAPMPGTGIIVTTAALQTDHELMMEVTMNEMSRTALAGFYRTPLIQLTDTSFIPLSGPAQLQGWLKRQRYDATNGLWVIDEWWVALDVTELAKGDNNVIQPKFSFEWLYSPLAASAI